ncbi:MAG: 16S rRNA (cytidine(1402)-2'-O)-methyltransferase [Candidatus Omnitrophica bacterium]|nr:16S rRNA (cytidine(1402)-2'-O)-methyltransferase [Candidatus Omnitrophota bacterium]MCM8809108.1 16S rRNA (cytidine(1402)-2'-O)-methyltransferase [Candidatus Omnitrophota bacterium]MCM8810778.1 16S rRNA (cytidine(1402)-2'-O)-methyltransferase [Candidatus Omnitrophota bacterium]MCM8832822.1 16S rRNA (cytidine(1402)-2'-O)-methyltransferase [Candidatus Omnitrophota bacterium]
MLYIVATPIGNIKDITLRALEVLKEVDLILCEDTRETGKLLNYYKIKKPLLSYYKEIEKKRVGKVIELLKEGKKIALVCDRGTPGISDPAYILLNEAYKNNIKVIPIPGPSALTAAMSISGFPLKKVYFLGFLPKKENQKRKVFSEFKEKNETFIFFESVHRIEKTINLLNEIMPENEVCICRELTKLFEEIIRGKVKEVFEIFKKEKKKGEFVIIIKGEKNGY